MKTMEFCSGSMLHGFQGNPWNFPHAFSMVFPWFSHAFSTRVVLMCSKFLRLGCFSSKANSIYNLLANLQYDTVSLHE